MFTTIQLSLGRFFIRLGNWIVAEVEPQHDSPGDPIAEIADHLNDNSAFHNIVDAGQIIPETSPVDKNIENVAKGISEKDWHPSMSAERQANEEATKKSSWAPYRVPPVFRKSKTEQVVSGRARAPMTVPHEVQYADGSKTVIDVKEKTDRDLWRPDWKPSDNDHCFSKGYTAEAHE